MIQGPSDALRVFLVNATVLVLVLAFAVAVTVLVLRREAKRRIAEARLTAMGVAAARILHQLQNPLQGLLLHSGLLEAPPGPDPDEARREVARAIGDEAGRIQEMLTELKLYASGGTRRLELRPTRLAPLLRSVVAERERVGPEGVELRLVEEAEPEAPVDAYYLRQALENLIRNGQDAVAEAGGGRVDVRLGREGRRAVVEVLDDGPGIPSERLATIFEPFVTTKSRGMGLGLPITREILEGHGGRIEAGPSPSGGARFLVEIPLEGPSRGVDAPSEPRLSSGP